MKNNVPDIKLGLRLTFRKENDSVILDFEHLSGAEVDLRNAIHFLSQFLPKFYCRHDNQDVTTSMEF